MLHRVSSRPPGRIPDGTSNIQYPASSIQRPRLFVFDKQLSPLFSD